MTGSADGWDVRREAVGYVQACYFKDCKAPVRSDREGSLNIDKTEGYDVTYENCRRLMEGYKNIDGSKVSKQLPVNHTDWTPTQTDAAYRVNALDKTADVPAIVQRYAGAGKIEVWRAHADAIPAEDLAEFAAAINDNPTEPTYDRNGNRITNVAAATAASEISHKTR